MGEQVADFLAGAGAVVSTVSAHELLQIARECGADDCALVSIDAPELDQERPYIHRAFPKVRTLLAFVKRMHREPLRSPMRSVANREFHSVGHEVDDIAREIVGRLEDKGIPALNPPMAFPMEMEDFPSRGWIVSHKRVAQAASLGHMGIHRSLIHPKFGSFILLGTVLVGQDVEQTVRSLEANPCLECKLCVAACPVGAIKPDGYFDFSSCFNHNYQQFMGGFVNFVEDVADSRSVRDFRSRQTYAETVTRWQSLAYGPNYNAAYCIAVCPAGTDVIGPYLADKVEHRRAVLDPLAAKVEPVYVVADSDAEAHVRNRFPHKMPRKIRSSARATSIEGFLFGMTLGFQPGKSKGLDATYHFTFSGAEPAEATVVIRNRKLDVSRGLDGQADMSITADSHAWIAFLNGELSILRAIATGKIRSKGPLNLLKSFARCFPS